MGRITTVLPLQTMEYEEAYRFQEQLAARCAAGACGDLLLLVQHPPVITVGRGGGWDDILAPASVLDQYGIRVLPTDRGGKATYHGPGQLVVYPILRLTADDLYGHAWRLEEAAIRTLSSFGLEAVRLPEYPGVWVRGQKIAAIGLSLREGVTRHGLALNIDPDLDHFRLLVPCGISGQGVTSMAHELGRRVDPAEVTARFVDSFADVFGCQMAWNAPVDWQAAGLERTLPCAEQPIWLWRRSSPGAHAAVAWMEHLLSDLGLHTVCQEADCPNVAECFEQRTAAFLILGDTCTRGCRFCAVKRGSPAPPDVHEAERVAQAAARLGLDYVVITSVTRDDLPDGGAEQFAAAIEAVRRRLPRATVEVLIPDLKGSLSALDRVLAARPDVLNHNLETVPRLYEKVRPGADYRRSVAILARVKAQAPRLLTKSGLMFGLGERTAEVLEVLHDLRGAGCDLLTLGQYLQPTETRLPVARYVPPQEFDWYRDKATALGFRGVASGPLVRSSHRARDLWSMLHSTNGP